MAVVTITEGIKDHLKEFLSSHKRADLITTYLCYLEKKFAIRPVVFMREKTIYRGEEELLVKLEEQGKLWRETEITIQVGKPAVNEETKKIYICPFTGKVFGNNTHPNPQDAIYDWVAKCPENTERVDGLKVERFYISEDKDVIKNYIEKRKDSVKKVVFSSGVTGKLFNSKAAVIEDFKKNQLRPIPLIEVPSQNRFQIDEEFLAFIQEQLDEGRISAFVEAMSEIGDFATNIDRWLEEAQEE